MTDFSHTITERWGAGGRSLDNSHDHAEDAQLSRDVDVPDSTTDQEVAITLDVSEIKAIYMVADGALTVETNDGGAATDTFNLTANKPLVWYNGHWASNPFVGGDVTAMFLTNASGASVRFQLECVYHSTPA